MLVLTLVKEIRVQMPLLGTRKLLHVLEPRLMEHGIKIGRDQLFNLLRFHGLLIRRRKRIVRTTDSNHIFKRYPNLIKELIITGPEQLWVSDITCIRTAQGFSYLSLITDAYSRKIVGYALHPNLEAIGRLRALEMAISNWKHVSPFYLIHHSDRGIQYCCNEYTGMLLSLRIRIPPLIRVRMPPLISLKKQIFYTFFSLFTSVFSVLFGRPLLVFSVVSSSYISDSSNRFFIR